MIPPSRSALIASLPPHTYSGILSDGDARCSIRKPIRPIPRNYVSQLDVLRGRSSNWTMSASGRPPNSMRWLSPLKKDGLTITGERPPRPLECPPLVRRLALERPRHDPDRRAGHLNRLFGDHVSLAERFGGSTDGFPNHGLAVHDEDPDLYVPFLVPAGRGSVPRAVAERLVEPVGVAGRVEAEHRPEEAVSAALTARPGSGGANGIGSVTARTICTGDAVKRIRSVEPVRIGRSEKISSRIRSGSAHDS